MIAMLIYLPRVTGTWGMELLFNRAVLYGITNKKKVSFIYLSREL